VTFLFLILALFAGPPAASPPQNPEDPGAWVDLARKHAAANEHGEAVAAWRRAAELGALSKADAEVEIAAAESAAGRRSEAFAALERALALGYRFRQRLAKDSRFQTLAGDPRWKNVLGTATSAPPGTAAAWRADLAYLEGEIRRLHPRFRDSPLPAEFAKLRNDLDRRVAGMTSAGVVVELQRLLATLGDGHTLAWPFGMRTGQLRRLPLSLWWFDDGFSVVGSADPALLGARLLRIGRLEPDEAARRIEPYVSRDNPMQVRWATPLYLVLTDYLLAIGATSTREEAELVFRLGSGVTKTVTLRAEDVDPEKLDTKLPSSQSGPYFLRRAQEPFWFTRLRAGIVYVQLNAIADAPARPLAGFARDLREEVRKDQPANLILDLRNNNGGDASFADEMLRTLISYDAAGGRVWIAIGRVTFSAAETFAARLDQWTGATFVGEPTGSRPNHYGNEAPFVLPHSGVRGTISAGWNQPVSGRDERIWIAPEIRVRSEASDFFAGRDAVLDRILLEIGRQ
jgi:hypothetical protein